MSLPNAADARIFFDPAEDRAVRMIEAKRNAIALEAARARQGSEHRLAAIESSEAEERLLRNLRPVLEVGSEGGGPGLHLLRNGWEGLALFGCHSACCAD